ncbi:hypothetical protein BKA83DRAFT_4478998 [Pisolithus microcarpus]|nr:hypothetical protein BKA83DRAFT_4478998 [Pisolithus microcarpus]
MSSGCPCVYVCGDAQVLSCPVLSLHCEICILVLHRISSLPRQRNRYRRCKIKIDPSWNQMNRQSSFHMKAEFTMHCRIASVVFCQWLISLLILWLGDYYCEQEVLGLYMGYKSVSNSV